MRKPKPSLYVRFRQPDGKQSSYCRAIYDGKSRLRPFWCLVRGTEEHHPEATYHQRTKRNGKEAWESLGTDPAAAWNKATVGKSVDTCKQELAVQLTPPEPAVTTDSCRMDAEVKTYLSNVETLAPADSPGCNSWSPRNYGSETVHRAPRAFATTVVAIGMPDGIVIAADSKGVYTGGAHGGPICKIMPIGLAFIAVLGLAWDVDYGFSVPATVRQAYTSDGTFAAWVAGTEKLMEEGLTIEVRNRAVL